MKYSIGQFKIKKKNSLTNYNQIKPTKYISYFELNSTIPIKAHKG